MNKSNSDTGNPYVQPRQRGAVLWKLATAFLLCVVIAQQVAFFGFGKLTARPKAAAKRRVPREIVALTPARELVIQQIAARGGTVGYDRYYGTINVCFAANARCEGCGQTAGFAPTGPASDFYDYDLALLNQFEVTCVDFAGTNVSEEGLLAFQRMHPQCQVTRSVSR
jgi:hypothetical protein